MPGFAPPTQRVCSVDAEIIAASGRPASAKLLQHPQGSGGSLCPSPAWVELQAGGTFWQVLSGVTGKEFPVAPLVRAEETQFLEPPFVLPRC